MKKVFLGLALAFTLSMFAVHTNYETSKPIKQQFELCDISTNFP
jgi:hypothetical protein